MKRVSKFLLSALFIVLVIALTACGRVQGEEGVMERIRSELSMPNAETVSLDCVEAVRQDGEVLFFFRIGGENNRSYAAASFLEKGEDSYAFQKKYTLMERGDGIRVLLWKNDYVFFIDNESCASMLIERDEGSITTVSVDGHPFVHHEKDATDHSFSYTFFDREGKEIQQA